MTVRNPALRYYGGKFRLGRKIALRFPAHESYCEPFGGAAGVLLRKEPSAVEVYNDMSGRLVNFFRVVRERLPELLKAVKRTPYARAEFDLSFEPSADPLEDARRYFVCAWQSFGGPRTRKITGWKTQRGVWTNSRANQLEEWHAASRNLVAVSRRFRSVQIESDDALKVVKRYDTPSTLFYCDPPYPSDTRNASWCNKAYDFEFTAHDHTHLANALKRIKGMAIVSTYPNDLYTEIFEGWEFLDMSGQTHNKTIATERLYFSPSITALEL